MEEKVLLKSERYNIKKLLIVLLMVGVVLSIFVAMALFNDELSYYDNLFDEDYEETHYLHTEDGCDFYERYLYEGEKCYRCEAYEQGRFDYAAEFFFGSDYIYFSLIPVAALALIGALIYWWLRSYELTITDKRVYGRTAFGKRVDLPVDSVSAVGSRWPKGITVATSSGKIAFLVIKNRDAIHKCVSDLLIDRQNKPFVAPTASVKQEIPVSNAEEIKKYKELLDMGAITQEEFDAKKKQLLGL